MRANLKARMHKAVFAVLLAISLTGWHANPKYVCAPAKPAACPLPFCDAGPYPIEGFTSPTREPLRTNYLGGQAQPLQ